MVNPPVIFPWKAESRAARVSAVALDPRFRGGDERSTSSRAIRVAGAKAFAAAGITLNEADHLMIYDAPGSLSGQASRICRSTASKIRLRAPREVGGSIAGHNTAPVGKLPFNANGGVALRHVRHVRAAEERPPDARHRPRPNPRCPDLGLPRRRRHVRRKRHHHHVE